MHVFPVMFFIISMTKLLDADWLRGVQLFQNKQNGGQAEFKHKRNCSRENKIRKYEQSTKFWLKVWREWNMMFTLRIVA